MKRDMSRAAKKRQSAERAIDEALKMMSPDEIQDYLNKFKLKKIIFRMSNFKAKLNSAVKLLRSSDLIQSENNFPKKPVDIASICREKSYVETWKFLLSESYFRILLKDYSFFMFYYEKMTNQEKYHQFQ